MKAMAAQPRKQCECAGGRRVPDRRDGRFHARFDRYRRVFLIFAAVFFGLAASRRQAADEND
jgi:hypothetical protein